MKVYIKPKGWEVDSEHTNFCCEHSKEAITYQPHHRINGGNHAININIPPLNNNKIKIMWVDYDGKTIKSTYGIINFCPFCGAKIEIEKRVD